MPFTKAFREYRPSDLHGKDIVYIPLHRVETWEQLYQSFSRNHRRELTKRRRKLDHKGSWHLKTNTDIDFESALVDIRRLYRIRQHQLGRNSIFDDSQFKQFIHRMLSHYQRQRCLNYSLLVLNDRAISFTLGFITDNRYYHWLIGFDPTCASLSPNKLHHAFLIQKLLHRGISEFNFMRGEADYKYRWSGQTRSLYETRIWNPQTRYSTLLKTLKGISRRRISRVTTGSPEVSLC
jgi:CelD/BcsL family acetyltransferase involved in cellulose biosynthesis